MLKTVKEITVPLVAEDLDKLDSFVDVVSGIRWHEVGSIETFAASGVYDLFISGKSIVIANTQQKWKAFDKVCPSCKVMVQWISYEKKWICFSCEKSLYVDENNGELLLTSYPLKSAEGKLYIGLKV